jgi:aconitate hydratase
MVRGTFANIRIRNFLAPGTEGGVTKYLGTPDRRDVAAAAPNVSPGDANTPLDPDIGRVMPIYDASLLYKAANVPTIILAGAEYGTGSSRDWAAKGTYLLGARAVLATTYERIHRSNLVNMGVLPLQFQPGESWQSLGLTGEEVYDIAGLDESLQPRSTVRVTATAKDGSVKTFLANVRIDTPVELDYYKNGGILQTVVRKLVG